MNKDELFDEWRKSLNGHDIALLQSVDGQKFLRELIDALDALPTPALGTLALFAEDGLTCALGAVCRYRGIKDQADWLAQRMRIHQFLQIDANIFVIVVHANDRWFAQNAPEERWRLMREWAAGQITPTQEQEPAPCSSAPTPPPSSCG